MLSLSIERKRETFVCDSSRVITRFYAPLDEARTEKIVERGHFICPYSNATKGNIDVVTELA